MGSIGRHSARWFDLEGGASEIPRWNVNMCYPCSISTKSSDWDFFVRESFVDCDWFMTNAGSRLLGKDIWRQSAIKYITGNNPGKYMGYSKKATCY